MAGSWALNGNKDSNIVRVHSLSSQLCFSHPSSLNLKSDLHSRDEFDRSHSKFLGKELTGQKFVKMF